MENSVQLPRRPPDLLPDWGWRRAAFSGSTTHRVSAVRSVLAAPPEQEAKDECEDRGQANEKAQHDVDRRPSYLEQFLAVVEAIAEPW